MGIQVVAGALLSDKGIQALFSNILCRVKGSCKPKLEKAARDFGRWGYIAKTDGWTFRDSQGNTSNDLYFLESGEFLTWEDSAANSIRRWYSNSGKAEHLANNGVDPCCLKASLPPSEFFRRQNRKMKQSDIVTFEYRGYTVNWDKELFDVQRIKFVIDESIKNGLIKDKGTSSTVSPKAQIGLPPVGQPLPAESGIGTLIVAGIGLFALTQANN